MRRPAGPTRSWGSRGFPAYLPSRKWRITGSANTAASSARRRLSNFIALSFIARLRRPGRVPWLVAPVRARAATSILQRRCSGRQGASGSGRAWMPGSSANRRPSRHVRPRCAGGAHHRQCCHLEPADAPQRRPCSSVRFANLRMGRCRFGNVMGGYFSVRTRSLFSAPHCGQCSGRRDQMPHRGHLLCGRSSGIFDCTNRVCDTSLLNFPSPFARTAGPLP